MFGKTGAKIHRDQRDLKINVGVALGASALLIAVAGLFIPNGSVLNAFSTVDCNTGLTAVGAVNTYSTNGVDGIGAYDLWLSEGNTGTKDDFIASLIGTKGADGYSGADGKSAYQLWLDEGNSGTTKEFIASLTGNQGVNGVNGLSAYELWLSVGNQGTLQQFLNSLIGASGANGANGTNGSTGQSAYAIWLENGNSGKTVADFLNSLNGATGETGAPGPMGSTGPVGASGAPGTNGTNGTNGVCVIGVGGYFGAFWDETTQTGSNPVNGMLLGHIGSNNGVTVVTDSGATSTPAAPGSWIKFDNAGTYNIAFSAQLQKSGGSPATVSIWLQKLNGSVHDIEYTNTNIGLGNNSTEEAAAWNFFVDVAAGDRVRLAWHTTDVGAVLQAAPPVSNGVTIPGIPSVIVTVNQVR